MRIAFALLALTASIILSPATAAPVTITGTVADSAGNPLEGHIQVLKHAPDGLTSHNFVTGEDGRYSATIDGARKVVVYVRAAYHTDAEYELPANSSGTVSLRSVLYPWQTVSGRVTDPRGNGIGDVLVKVRTGKPDARRRHVELHHEEVRTDADGNFTHPRAPVGTPFYWQVYLDSYLAAVSDSTYISEGQEAVSDVVVSRAAIDANISGVNHAPDLAPEWWWDELSFCEIVIKPYNRRRKIGEDGAVNAECGWPWDPPWHSKPYGNWGVTSPYGPREDKKQFKGWKWEDGPSWKLQWNSCTTYLSKYKTSTGKNDFYYPNSYDDRQIATPLDDVRFGLKTVMVRQQICLTLGNSPPAGCSTMNGYKHKEYPYMDIYELDSDGDDSVAYLVYPPKAVTFSGCSTDGCPEKSTPWTTPDIVSPLQSKVSAELRMKMSARHVSQCSDNDY